MGTVRKLPCRVRAARKLSAVHCLACSGHAHADDGSCCNGEHGHAHGGGGHGHGHGESAGYRSVYTRSRRCACRQGGHAG